MRSSFLSFDWVLILPGAPDRCESCPGHARSPATLTRTESRLGCYQAKLTVLFGKSCKGAICSTGSREISDRGSRRADRGLPGEALDAGPAAHPFAEKVEQR